MAAPAFILTGTSSLVFVPVVAEALVEVDSLVWVAFGRRLLGFPVAPDVALFSAGFGRVVGMLLEHLPPALAARRSHSEKP